MKANLLNHFKQKKEKKKKKKIHFYCTFQVDEHNQMTNFVRRDGVHSTYQTKQTSSDDNPWSRLEYECSSDVVFIQLTGPKNIT